MPSLPTTTTTTATSAAATYTTIPISFIDVIYRSTQNLSSALARARPWPEFLSSFDLPASLSAAYTRFRRNAAYFSVNYSIILTACAAVSLIGSPLALLVVGLVFFLWLVLHFFREDPLLVWGRHVSDLAVGSGLVLVTFVAFWVTGPLNSLSLGIGVGLVIAVVHGVLRNAQGIFVDEDDAVYDGLIASKGSGGGGASSSWSGGGAVSFNPPL